MANIYVKSTGSGTSPYDTWAKAATTLKVASDFASANDTIFVYAESYSTTATTTWTFASGVRVICTSDSAAEPPTTVATTGVIDGSATASINFILDGGPVYIYGLTFQVGSGATTCSIIVASTDLDKFIFDNCVLRLTSTSVSSGIIFGTSNSSSRTEICFKDSSVRFGNAGQGITSYTTLYVEGGSFLHASSTVPTTLFETFANKSQSMSFSGVNFSSMSSGTVFSNNGNGHIDIILSQCRLGSATLNAALTIGSNEYWLYDCSTGDTHYAFQHLSYPGSTTISTTIYANDGASYDISGTKHSWVVAGNANTTYANQYRSPWISRYNEGVSAVTPYLEILRDGSTTPYTDIEVWGEFACKVTTGYPITTVNSSDFGGLLSTGTNQATGVGTSGWTGDTGAWSGKLAPSATITPAEIGHIKARVVVAGNHTVYVDPQIRGL